MPRTPVASILLLALLLLSCGGVEPRPEPRAAAPEPASTPAVPIETIVARAQARVEGERLRADVDRLATAPRWASGARAHHDAMVAWIADELAELGYAVERQPVTHGDVTADNVIAERAGVTADRWVLLGAHHDTVRASPGADDNASGVAALLAVARALADTPTRAGLRFVAFALEEEHLVGSTAYVERLVRDPNHGLEVAVIVDMIGYRDRSPGSQRWPAGVERLAGGRVAPDVGDFIGAVWLTDIPFEIEQRFEAAAGHAPELRLETLAVPRVALTLARDLSRGDHASFWEARLPAIAISDIGPLRNPHYHLESDRAETLDFDFLTDATRWLTAALLLLAEPAT